MFGALKEFFLIFQMAALSLFSGNCSYLGDSLLKQKLTEVDRNRCFECAWTCPAPNLENENFREDVNEYQRCVIKKYGIKLLDSLQLKFEEHYKGLLKPRDLKTCPYLRSVRVERTSARTRFAGNFITAEVSVCCESTEDCDLRAKVIQKKQEIIEEFDSTKCSALKEEFTALESKYRALHKDRFSQETAEYDEALGEDEQKKVKRSLERLANKYDLSTDQMIRLMREKRDATGSCCPRETMLVHWTGTLTVADFNGASDHFYPVMLAELQWFQVTEETICLYTGTCGSSCMEDYQVVSLLVSPVPVTSIADLMNPEVYLEFVSVSWPSGCLCN